MLRSEMQSELVSITLGRQGQHDLAIEFVVDN